MATSLRPRQDWTITPPAGWEPVADLCREVYDDLEEVVDHLTSVFTAEIPAFLDAGSPFTADDLRWSSMGNIAGFLAGLAEHRPLLPEEIEFRRFVGERSCAVGSPLQPLIASFHICYRELWSILVARAEAHGGDAPKLLLGAGSSVWERMHETVEALTEGYERALLRREANELRLTAELFDAIARDPSSARSRALAERHMLAPDDAFVAIAVLGPAGSLPVARAIVSRLSPHRATANQDGPLAFVLAQVDGVAVADAVAAALAELDPDVHVGIGSEATGLEGAGRSIEEARLALAYARSSGRHAWFTADWLHVLAHAHRASLEAMLDAGITTTGTHPHLTEAVAAYSEANGSIAEGARRLRLSENSFRHRLNRWQQLTGWDPRTHDGMTRSLVALDLAADTRSIRT